ncbi:hypothetical protein Tco_0348683 [Tanacetum coccineum]
MNCPLAEAFTKSHLVVYQNFPREFWCIAIASHLNPPTDDSEARPLKEYLIKFSVMNGKKPLTIDFKAFTVSTGLDYAKGKYVSHPFTKEVLGGNYSSTEQVNSIQQLFAYCLLTRIKGPEDSGSLPQRRKKPKSKTSPLELTEDSKQSHSVSSGHVPDPQDPEKQTTRLKLPADMEPLTNPVADPSGTDTSSEVESNSETLQLKTFANVQALLLSNDELLQESDDEDMTYDNIFPLTERQLVKYLRKVSRVLCGRITEDQWAQHEEVVVSYADLRASIEGYYEENVDHKDQTDKLVQATMNCLDKNSTKRADLLKALNGVTKTLKVVQEAVKDDHALKKKNFDFQGLKSSIESLQATAISQDQHLAAWAKQDTLDIKSMMIEIYNAFKGQPFFAPSGSVLTTLAITATPIKDDTEKPDSDKAKKEPTNAVPISTVKPTETLTSEVLPIATIISTSQPKSSQVPQREGKGISSDEQLKMYHLTNDEINALMEKEDKIKKDAEEAKMFEMTKTKVIKAVQEEVEKIGVDLVHKQTKPISLNSTRKREHMELEPEIKVPRLECNRSLPEGV